MALIRMGSLNALEQTSGNSFWKRWIGDALPSADTTARVFTLLESNDIRTAIKHVYTRLKRNKALRPHFPGLFALIVDGHESSTSYLRCCEQCLQRVIRTKHGDRIQYYHRNVTAVLSCKDFLVLLDIELQRPDEDELTTAMRLIERVIVDYPRAFNLILADGLYARANFFKLALKYGKNVIAVLKDDRRDLLQDAIGIFNNIEPTVNQCGRTHRQCWDIEHFTSWPQVDREVRVVRSLETTTIRRQMSGEEEQRVADWVWVSTISKQKLPTAPFVDFGHSRWAIENNELNELVTYWQADHVYKHDSVAIEAFWLLIMLAYNLFHAFINLNLKPEIRYKRNNFYWARVIAAEIYYLKAPCPSLVPT